jgi:hypothetical protein
LLVVAAGDLEDVALELITNAVAWNLGAHSTYIVRIHPSSLFPFESVAFVPLVHENTQLSLIFNFNKLLAAIGRLLWRSVDLFSRCGKFRGTENVRRKCSIDQNTLAYILDCINKCMCTHQLHLDGGTGSRR